MNMKPINIEIPEDLHKKIKNVANERGCRMPEVIIEALERYFREHRNG